MSDTLQSIHCSFKLQKIRPSNLLIEGCKWYFWIWLLLKWKRKWQLLHCVISLPTSKVKECRFVSIFKKHFLLQISAHFTWFCLFCHLWIIIKMIYVHFVVHWLMWEEMQSRLSESSFWSAICLILFSKYLYSFLDSFLVHF